MQPNFNRVPHGFGACRNALQLPRGCCSPHLGLHRRCFGSIYYERLPGVFTAELAEKVKEKMRIYNRLG